MLYFLRNRVAYALRRARFTKIYHIIKGGDKHGKEAKEGGKEAQASKAQATMPTLTANSIQVGKFFV